VDLDDDEALDGDSATGRTPGSDQRGRVVTIPSFFRTNTGADLLAEGLAFVGFDGKRQANASTDLNVKR
jgi:hypothetical protein